MVKWSLPEKLLWTELYSMQSILFSTNNCYIFGNIKQRQNFYYEVKKKIILAKILKTKVIVFGSPKNKKTFGKKKDVLDKLSYEMFKKISSISEKNKITFCLEANPKIYGTKYLTHTIDAIKLVQKHGGNAGIRFTITKETQDSFYQMFDLCEELNVDKLYISHLVYSGRGEDNLEIDISKDERRKYVDFIIDKAFEYYENNSKIDLVTGNMEMDAIMLLNRFKEKYPDKVDLLEQKLKAWGGNSAGNRLGNMDWAGNVKPDPFFPFTVGNYLQTPFDEIWTSKKNDILNQLRTYPRNIKGKCADCKYISICNGGSRSRAYAITGDLWQEDPSCYLTQEEIRK